LTITNGNKGVTINNYHLPKATTELLGKVGCVNGKKKVLNPSLPFPLQKGKDF